MSRDNKEILRRFLETCLNRGDLDAVGDFIAPDFVDHLFPDRSGVEGAKQGLREFRAAFPDIHDSPEDMIAEGDRVVIRYTMTGTHRGEFMGRPATGKKVKWSGINISRFADGKIVERWGFFDALGLLQQLEAPVEGNASSLPRGGVGRTSPPHHPLGADEAAPSTANPAVRSRK